MKGTRVRVSVDCGESHFFMSVSAARRCGLTIFEDSSEVELGDKSIVTVYGRSTGNLTVGETKGEEEIFIVPEGGQKQKDELPTVIIGRRWQRKHSPDINWRTGIWLLRDRMFQNRLLNLRDTANKER